MRHALGRVGEVLPALVATLFPVLFIPTLTDAYVLPRASLAVAGGCLLALGVPLTTRRHLITPPAYSLMSPASPSGEDQEQSVGAWGDGAQPAATQPTATT